MPRGLQGHPAERVDLDDFTKGARTYSQEMVGRNVEHIIVDHQSRIRRGFRVELPDQGSYPGRIVIHGGSAYDVDGNELFNEDQLTVSRTITLEGTSTTFYVEIEFIESDGDVDARGFWDPTVDQGTDPSGDPRPDGQEFSDNVATTKVPDWRIVTPISTSAFARDSDPSSAKIPLIKLTTDGSNEINSTGTPGLATDKATTTILEVVSTTVLRVQDAQMFPNGSDITVGLGASGQETAVIATSNPVTNIITLSGALSNSHNPGEIVKGRLTSSLDLITESDYNRYRRPNATNPIDWKDKLFQGDEVHGEILSEGHDTTPDDQSSDVNLQSLKDHIDFLSAQLEELKWGARNPYLSTSSADRAPPGVTNNIPTTPRYFHKSGGVQGARETTITVGSGVFSWGDFNGSDGSALTAAINSSSPGGTIYVKRGAYLLSSDVVINKDLTIIFDQEAIVYNYGGGFDIQVSGEIIIKGLRMDRAGSGSPTTRGLYFNTSTPTKVWLDDIELTDLNIQTDVVLPKQTFALRVWIYATHAAMASVPLVYVGAAAGQIRGTWEKCVFTHTSAVGTVGSCVDASFVATNGMADCVWKDCNFNQSLINAGTVNIKGSSSSYVTFERCHFDGTLTNTSGHIVATNSAKHISVVDCVVLDNDNRLVNFDTCTNVMVDNCRSDVGSLYPLTRMVNCSDVIIRNCHCRLGSAGTSLVESAFKFETTSTSSRILIEGNYIEAGTNTFTGMIFDVPSGAANDGYYGVTIVNNTFVKCEVGLYFKGTPVSCRYDTVTITGNKFHDIDGTFPTVASYQKIGILLGTNPNGYHWTVSDNQFVGINPASSSTVSGRTRAALDIIGTAEDFIVSDNLIKNVGNASNPLANTAALRFAALNKSVIADNLIDGVYGANAYGMILSESTNSAQALSVSGNKFQTISTDSTGSIVCGITATNIEASSFTGNEFRNVITAAAAGSGAAFYLDDVSAGDVDRVSITGNTLWGADDDVSLIYFNALNITNLTISSNVGSGSLDGFAELLSGAGGTIQEVNIIGNTFSNCNGVGNIDIRPGAASSRGINILGNTLQVDSTTYNITLQGCTLFKISGNTCINDDTTINNNNIYIVNGGRFMIDNNLCRLPNTANAQVNIYVAATSDRYLISSNKCDKGGGTAGYAIDTNSSGATSQYNLVVNNHFQGNTNIEPNDYGESGAFQAAGPVGQVYTG